MVRLIKLDKFKSLFTEKELNFIEKVTHLQETCEKEKIEMVFSTEIRLEIQKHITETIEIGAEILGKLSILGKSSI